MLVKQFDVSLIAKLRYNKISMKRHPEYQYLELMAKILKDGKTKPTRGIVPIKSIFGYQMSFDMRHGFPLLTTKKMPFTLLAHELLWFVSGSSNIKYLQDHKIHYWDHIKLNYHN